MNSYLKKYYKLTPEGTKDLVFEECSARIYIQNKLEKIFDLRGFNRVMTPSIEYLDLFLQGNSRIDIDSVYKFTDMHGRLLALRADSTLPITRLVATRLQNATDPKRLYYFHKIYRNNPGLRGMRNEVMQAGVEVLGATGVKTDLEVIITAYETLKECSEDFRIELSYAGLFQSLIQNLQATDEAKEQIRSLIESKNYGMLNTVLDDIDNTDISQAIRILPKLFGGEEVFYEAYKISPDDKFTSQLDYLKNIFKILKYCKLEDKFIIDLGLVNRNYYYSGVVFSGYVNGIAEPVLSGGRYDKLANDFNMSKPAIGFGIDIDLLANLALETGNVPIKSNATVLVHCDNGYESNMIEYAEKLHGENVCCEYSTFSTINEALDYAKVKNMLAVYYIKDDVKKIVL